MIRPDFSLRMMDLDVGYVNQLLGLSLAPSQVKVLLERMRFGVEVKQDKLCVCVPPYRADVLHPIDLVEDVAIAYGYMKFEPAPPKLATLGRAHPLERQCEAVRDVMVGLQFREVMTLILSNRRDLYERMNAPDEDAVEAVKPVSIEHGVARTWLLPSLMVVLEKNRNREYPQMLFEVGEVLDAQGQAHMVVAAVIAHSRTSFSQIKASVGGLALAIKADAGNQACSHPSFIEGRCAGNPNGFYGELSPQVLANFGLEVPVTAFEMRLN
jgi:phenylalanyl-tRNA synthetase beta chain